MCLGALWLAGAEGATAKDRPPNVVFILADDLGWSDLACYGADLHETPNLDRVAREGVRFTQAYAMSVCSPSRAAILTGKHAARLRMTIWREAALEIPSTSPLRPPRAVADLPQAEVTLAERLKAAGYLTFHVGKWHLGDAAHAPETQGFDVNIGGTHWGAPATFFHPFRGVSGSGDFRYVPGLGVGKAGDYLPDRFTDEALRLIQEAGDRPFFLNLWFHTPHAPIEGKPELVRHYEKKIRSDMRHQNAGYAAMVHNLDQNVGRILNGLEKRGLADRTLLIFTSDNGGAITSNRGRQITDNTPLRSGKGSLYEGGIRVPLIVRLPGVTPRGAICEQPVLCTDFCPTLLELCGLKPAVLTEAGNGLDGISFAPLLRDPATQWATRDLFFHYPHYYPTTKPVSAIRSGDWKLLQYFEDQRVELYDLRHDPGERRDVATQHPQRAEELRSRLHAWWAEVKAGLPEPNR